MTPRRAAGPQATLRDWLAVGGGVLGAFMAILDIQITNASLAEIRAGDRRHARPRAAGSRPAI